ncbi:hypothetical protein F4818DRAFT_443846 [Hypoxylon cercidicola]|nr:hypothetical protein F4818DRAFT_443846 [Hypoxylon cercidicola]
MGPIGNMYNGMPDGYTLGNVTWTGNITANGPEISFTGHSFQDIEAQIRQANPNFDWPDHNVADLSLPNKAVDRLSCDLPQFWYADKFHVDDGIEYLRGKTGRCHIDAGPQFCSRISCSYDSAIFWCNDRDSRLSIDCNLWAQYAQDVRDACTTDDPSEHVKGQEFSTYDWNIIIGYSKC